MKILLKILLCLTLVIVLPAHANSSEAPESKIEKLRQQQKADLDRIKDEYDNRARKEVPRRQDGTLDTDSPQYKDLKNEYTSQRNKVQDEYKSKDPRTADFDPKNEIKGVKNTGSAPKDVRADADWAAESPEAANAKTDQWKNRGDVVVDEGHKIVNKTTDETLWKPGYKPGDKGLVSDGDAHGTQGGIEKVTRIEGKEGFEKSGDGVRDPEGVALDNEKKFLDAQKRGNQKDMSKTVVKAGDSTGRSADPAQKDLYETAKGQKNYGDEITSGVSDLGDDPDMRAKKVADYQKNLDAEMRQNVAEGQKQGAALDNQRKQIADSAQKTETSGDKAWNDAKNKANYGETNTTSEEIDTRRQKVADSNRATAEANQKARADLEGSGGKMPDAETSGNTAGKGTETVKGAGPTTDGPEGRSTTADTPDGKPRGPATDASEGKFGKAVDKFGKGMQAVDILSGAQDFKEAAKKGDVEGMGKAAVNAADGLTGGVKGTVDTLVTKGSDRAAAQDDIEQANRANLENQNQHIANDLQRSGMDKDEIKGILDAKARGDEGPLHNSYEKLGKPIPTLVVEKPVEGDDTVIDRTKEVAVGIGEKVVKAGTFVKETGEDVGEIATGLTENGVAREVINQQKENLSPSNIGDGLGAITDTINAGRENTRAKDSLADKLVEKGASREDAAKAAEAWSKGDRSQLDGLKEKLGLPVANPKADGKGQDGKPKTDGSGADGKPKGEALGQDGKPKDDAGGKGEGENGDAEKTGDGEKKGLVKEPTTEKGPEIVAPPELPVGPAVTETAKPDGPVPPEVDPKAESEKESGAGEKKGLVKEPTIEKGPEIVAPPESPAGPAVTETAKPNEPTSPEVQDGDGGTTSQPDNPGETTVDKGYVESSDGSRITITEKTDGSGKVINQTHTTTDSSGNVTEKTVYPGEAGEGKTTNGSGEPNQDSLKGQEPTAGEPSVPVPGAGASSGSSLGQYADQNKADTQQKTGDAITAMGQNSQLGEAANVANQQIQDAQNIQDSGARDAETTQTESAQKTAQADRDNSLGNEIGDAVEKGITQGGQAFGGAIGGAAADKVADDVFGEPHKDGNSSSDHGHEGTQVASADAPTSEKHSPSGPSGSDGEHGGKHSKEKRPTADDDSVPGVEEGGSSEEEAPPSPVKVTSVSPVTKPTPSPATKATPATEGADTIPQELYDKFYKEGLRDGRACRSKSGSTASMDCVLGIPGCSYANIKPKWVPALKSFCIKGFFDGENGK